MTKTFSPSAARRPTAVAVTDTIIRFRFARFTCFRKSTSFSGSSVLTAGAVMASFSAVHAGQASRCRSTAPRASSPRRFST